MVAVFAAIQALVTVIPFSVAIGVSGSITLGVVTAPLFGILLAPALGGLSVLVGTLAGLFLNPGGAIFGPFTAIPPTLAALAAGSVRVKRGFAPGALILASVALFYAHPFGREAPFYPWLDVLAMILCFSPVVRLASTSFASAKMRSLTFAVAVAAFVGTLADHAFGSGLAIWYFSLPAPVWDLVMYIYPIERLVTVAVVTLVGVPVYHRLKLSGIIST
jgi:hypothetical protein